MMSKAINVRDVGSLSLSSLPDEIRLRVFMFRIHFMRPLLH